ncbi:hypothetical protein MHH70_13460 [Metasolibacillus sp. FSL H7-0170]|uniref:hypothetical protein n=1 Tax=Metasolibacillus sp. FSL H7-0170 TaxID=2921431 RepID=UPI0031596368
MRKFMIFLLILIGCIFLFVSLQKKTLEDDVVEYLITEEKIEQDDIISSEAFISNLQGSKNFMVSIKLKSDHKTYFYYKKDGRIILESYVENGREHVMS